MEDDRLWGFEQSLWIEGPDNYREKVSDEVLMVLPRPPFLFAGADAIAAVIDTPQWDRAELADRHVVRPQEGLIVLAYSVKAERDGGERYAAHCTTVLRRLEHEVWRVVQHQQTPAAEPRLRAEAA